jgi:chemotaxis signal transduction protein
MPSSFDERDSAAFTPLTELQMRDLERMSDEEFWNYARQRVYTLPEAPTHAEYLECKLSGRTCLIALHDLAEVLPPPHKLARLPEMPAWMTGIMAWRDETIAVVNLDLYLPPAPGVHPLSTAECTLLVAHSTGRSVGLLVPAIGLTSRIEFAQISALTDPPGLVPTRNTEIFDGVYLHMPILNISTLLAALVKQIGWAPTHG